MKVNKQIVPEWKNDLITLDQISEAASYPNIPQVGVYDENNKLLFTGFYICHINRQAYCDSTNDKDDIDHLVAYSESADWGLPRGLRIKRITPPHKIKVLS